MKLRCSIAMALLATATPGLASPISPFASFTPLGSSAPAGSLPEAKPFQLSSSLFHQKTALANDAGPQSGGTKLGDNWDMITSNENGPDRGRYLFSPYETGTAGVRRLDTKTGQAVELVAPGTQGFVSGDPSRWTPFGTYLTGEESWGTGSDKGRVFEITNPLAAPGSINFVQHNVIPRTSQEGMAFDKNNAFYFVDELNGGTIYRYVSQTPTDGATYFSAGQTFVLQVGAGSNYEMTGAAKWVPITDAAGTPLPGVPTVTAQGVSVVDGRGGAAFVGATGFNRPEDLEIQTLADGSQILYFNATDTHHTYSIKLGPADTANVALFVDQNTINAFNGMAVGSEFINPDNLAIDAAGNIYIVEDQPGGVADIWFAQDANRDGIAEWIGRWASMTTVGAEPTGLYFDPLNPNRAFIDVQHAASDVDRLIEIDAVPEPATIGLSLAGLAAMGALRKRRRRA